MHNGALSGAATEGKVRGSDGGEGGSRDADEGGDTSAAGSNLLARQQRRA